MSIKRKTLKQKRLSDLRKTQTTQDTELTSSVPVYSFTARAKHSSIPQTQPTFTYDLSDVRQSLIVSSALILVNAVIYVLVENGMIPLRIIGL